METVIREGTLRLHTSDTSCDVILNCQGHRLTAHKLILSIASPILRDLLTTSRDFEPSNLIFPDVSGTTMSLILDYIYTGSVVLYLDTIAEFLSVARLLKLQLDDEFLEKPKKEVDILKYAPEEDVAKPETEVFSRKNQRKLPNLVPIQKNFERRKKQSLCDHVLPNPWRPRISTILLDPKKDYPVHNEVHNRVQENDNNNNFHFPTSESMTLPNFFSNALQERIFPSLNTQSIFNRFHHKENLQLINQSGNHKNEEKTNTFNEEKYHSSDSNKSFSSLKLRIEDTSNVSKTSSPDLDLDDDAEISVGEESVEIAGTKTENDGKLLKTDDAKNKPFVCEDCGKSFSQLRNYKYHRSVHEGTKEFAAKCQECGKIFNDRGYLSSHMKIHRDKKEYACTHCPKRFNQRVAYNMHLRIHTGIKPHECQTCGKSFSRKMLLKQHQRVHTGERPYSCPECGKTFADRSNMSLHARLHTGVKPYACSLCPKSFTKKHHLKTHMNFHTGLKPYSCEKCGLSFSQSSNMRTHYKKCILKGPPSSCSTKTSEPSLEAATGPDF